MSLSWETGMCGCGLAGCATKARSANAEARNMACFLEAGNALLHEHTLQVRVVSQLILVEAAAGAVSA